MFTFSPGVKPTALLGLNFLFLIHQGTEEGSTMKGKLSKAAATSDHSGPGTPLPDPGPRLKSLECMENNGLMVCVFHSWTSSKSRKEVFLCLF